MGKHSQPGFWRRFVEVPDSLDGWATRVLTIAVVFVFVISFALLRQLNGLIELAENARDNRTSFQLEQQRRTCELLRVLGHTPAAKLRGVGC